MVIALLTRVGHWCDLASHEFELIIEIEEQGNFENVETTMHN